MEQEKRAHRRFSVELAAEIALEGDVVVGSTQNLSSGGVAVVLDRVLKEETYVPLTLFLTEDGIENPDEEPFEAVAAVAWTAERDAGSYVCGLRFENLSASQQAQLGRFLEALE